MRSAAAGAPPAGAVAPEQASEAQGPGPGHDDGRAQPSLPPSAEPECLPEAAATQARAEAAEARLADAERKAAQLRALLHGAADAEQGLRARCDELAAQADAASAASRQAAPANHAGDDALSGEVAELRADTERVRLENLRLSAAGGAAAEARAAAEQALAGALREGGALRQEAARLRAELVDAHQAGARWREQSSELQAAAGASLVVPVEHLSNEQPATSDTSCGASRSQELLTPRRLPDACARMYILYVPVLLTAGQNAVQAHNDAV